MFKLNKLFKSDGSVIDHNLENDLNAAEDVEHDNSAEKDKTNLLSICNIISKPGLLGPDQM